MTPLYAAAIRYAEAVRDQSAKGYLAGWMAVENAKHELLAAAFGHPYPKPAPFGVTVVAIDTPGGSDSQIGEDH